MADLGALVMLFLEKVFHDRRHIVDETYKMIRDYNKTKKTANFEQTLITLSKLLGKELPNIIFTYLLTLLEMPLDVPEHGCSNLVQQIKSLKAIHHSRFEENMKPALIKAGIILKVERSYPSTSAGPISQGAEESSRSTSAKKVIFKKPRIIRRPRKVKPIKRMEALQDYPTTSNQQKHSADEMFQSTSAGTSKEGAEESFPSTSASTSSQNGEENRPSTSAGTSAQQKEKFEPENEVISKKPRIIRRPRKVKPIKRMEALQDYPTTSNQQKHSADEMFQSTSAGTSKKSAEESFPSTSTSTSSQSAEENRPSTSAGTSAQQKEQFEPESEVEFKKPSKIIRRPRKVKPIKRMEALQDYATTSNQQKHSADEMFQSTSAGTSKESAEKSFPSTSASTSCQSAEENRPSTSAGTSAQQKEEFKPEEEVLFKKPSRIIRRPIKLMEALQEGPTTSGQQKQKRNVKRKAEKDPEFVPRKQLRKKEEPIEPKLPLETLQYIAAECILDHFHHLKNFYQAKFDKAWKMVYSNKYSGEPLQQIYSTLRDLNRKRKCMREIDNDTLSEDTMDDFYKEEEIWYKKHFNLLFKFDAGKLYQSDNYYHDLVVNGHAYYNN